MSREYNPAMFKVDNIGASVANKDKLNATPFRINERGSFYIVGGQEIPKNEYEKQHPTELLKISRKGENPNRRNRF